MADKETNEAINEVFSMLLSVIDNETGSNHSQANTPPSPSPTPTQPSSDRSWLQAPRRGPSQNLRDTRLSESPYSKEEVDDVIKKIDSAISRERAAGNVSSTALRILEGVKPLLSILL